MNPPIARNSAPIIPSGVQLSSAIVPPGCADADHLVGRLLMVRREHDSDRGHDDVKGLVVEREILGIGLDPLEGDALRLGPRPARLEQVGGEVAGRDLRTGLGGGDRRVAGAGRDVEHLHPLADPGGLDEPRPQREQERLDHGRVIAGRPHGPVL